MTTVVFCGVLIALGVAIIIRSIAAGVGGGLGLILGAMFVLAGVLRLYLHRRRG